MSRFNIKKIHNRINGIIAASALSASLLIGALPSSLHAQEMGNYAHERVPGVSLAYSKSARLRIAEKRSPVQTRAAKQRSNNRKPSSKPNKPTTSPNDALVGRYVGTWTIKKMGCRYSGPDRFVSGFDVMKSGQSLKVVMYDGLSITAFKRDNPFGFTASGWLKRTPQSISRRIDLVLNRATNLATAKINDTVFEDGKIPCSVEVSASMIRQ